MGVASQQSAHQSPQLVRFQGGAGCGAASGSVRLASTGRCQRRKAGPRRAASAWRLGACVPMRLWGRAGVTETWRERLASSAAGQLGGGQGRVWVALRMTSLVLSGRIWAWSIRYLQIKDKDKIKKNCSLLGTMNPICDMNVDEVGENGRSRAARLGGAKSGCAWRIECVRGILSHDQRRPTERSGALLRSWSYQGWTSRKRRIMAHRTQGRAQGWR